MALFTANPDEMSSEERLFAAAYFSVLFFGVVIGLLTACIVAKHYCAEAA